MTMGYKWGKLKIDNTIGTIHLLWLKFFTIKHLQVTQIRFLNTNSDHCFLLQLFISFIIEKVILDEFDISKTTFYNIKNNKTWRI